MTRFALLFVCALALAACLAGNPQPSGTALAPTLPSVTAAPSTAAEASATPAVEPSTGPTAVPGSGLCPADAPLTVRQFVRGDSQCLGRPAIQVRGWLDAPPTTGFEPPDIEPGWMYYPLPEGQTIWEAQPAGRDDCHVDGDQCAWFWPHIDPASGLTLGGQPRWVILTGHVDDPAAAQCHWVYPADFPVASRDDADAVALCRGGFVVDSFEDAP